MILTKKNINKLKSKNQGFNGKSIRYLLKKSGLTYPPREKGWLEILYSLCLVVSDEEYLEIYEKRNDHLKKKKKAPVKKSKRKKLTFYQKCNMLETDKGRKKLKKLGYNFTLRS